MTQFANSDEVGTGHDTSIELRARYRGSLLGLTVGDALGTTIEFEPPGSFQPIEDVVGGGPFNLPAGAWTDDTSMALCLAESLLECDGFDAVDQLRRYEMLTLSGMKDGEWVVVLPRTDVDSRKTAVEQVPYTPTPKQMRLQVVPVHVIPTLGGTVRCCC